MATIVIVTVAAARAAAVAATVIPAVVVIVLDVVVAAVASLRAAIVAATWLLPWLSLWLLWLLLCQKFLLNRLQAVRTHGACNTVSGPMVTQPIPDVQAWVRTPVCRMLAPPPGGQTGLRTADHTNPSAALAPGQRRVPV